MPFSEPLTVRIEADLAQFKREFNAGERSIEAFSRQVQQESRSISNFFKGGMLGSFSSVIREMSDGAVEQLEKLDKATAIFAAISSIGTAARRIGISTQALQELRFTATQAGLEIETLDGALKALGDRVRGVAGDQGGFLEILRQNGVSVKDLDGQTRALEDLFIDYADVVRDAGDEQEKLRLAVEGFGSVGPALIPFLSQSLKFFLRMREEAHRLGIVLDNEIIQRATDMGKAFTRLDQVLDAHLQRGFVATASALEAGAFADGVSELGAAIRDLSNSLSADNLPSLEKAWDRLKKLFEDMSILDSLGDTGSGLIPGSDQEGALKPPRGQPGGPSLAFAAIGEPAFAGDIRQATRDLQEAGASAKSLNGAAHDLGFTFASAFEDAVVEGRRLSDVLQGLERDILRILTRKLVTEPLAGAVTEAIGGGRSLLGDLFGATTFHDGGVVALSVPRLAPNEVPAILRRGEVVRTPAQEAALARHMAGGGATHIVVNIQTHSPAAFGESRGQIEAMLTDAVRRGRRNR